MRYFTTAIILAAFFIIGFTATPASANKHGGDTCAALIKKVEDNKEGFQTDGQLYSQITGKLEIAKAAQENGKKKKCKKVAKKALIQMGL